MDLQRLHHDTALRVQGPSTPSRHAHEKTLRSGHLRLSRAMELRCRMTFGAVKRIPISALATVALGFATPASPNEYRDNPPIVIDRVAEKQFLPIGELEFVALITKNGKRFQLFGTGFLVSPCYIVTSFHIVFHVLEPEPGKDYPMKFHIGVAQNSAFLGSTKAIPVKWGSIGMAGANDWAILKLTTCIGARPDFGWFESADIPPGWLTGQHVAVAGFSGQNARGILSYSEGDVRTWDSPGHMLKYSASENEGQSGSPILMIIDGDLRVVGVNQGTLRADGVRDKSQFETYADDNASLFVPLADVLNRPDIKAMLDADKKLVGSHNLRFTTACFLMSQTHCKVYTQPPDGTNIEAYDPGTGHWSKTGDAAWIHPHPAVNLPNRDR